MHFVVVFGPPAVGKMTVGREICTRTGYKLLHNHMTIEPVLEIFPFGSPPFDRISGGLRRDVIREAAEYGLPGLVFTFVWGVELESDVATVAEYDEIVRSRGGSVDFVELYADLEAFTDHERQPHTQRFLIARDQCVERVDVREVDPEGLTGFEVR